MIVQGYFDEIAILFFFSLTSHYLEYTNAYVTTVGFPSQDVCGLESVSVS